MTGKVLVKNKRAHFDYEIKDTLLAGVVLSGAEVKSLRAGQASLSGAYVQIMTDDQVILLNAQITPYQHLSHGKEDYDPQRTRQLLLRKKEIEHLKIVANQKGYALIPLAFVLQGAFIKLEIGVGKGKKQFEKRDLQKRKDLDREASRF